MSRIITLFVSLGRVRKKINIRIVLSPPDNLSLSSITGKKKWQLFYDMWYILCQYVFVHNLQTRLNSPTHQWLYWNISCPMLSLTSHTHDAHKMHFLCHIFLNWLLMSLNKTKLLTLWMNFQIVVHTVRSLLQLFRRNQYHTWDLSFTSHPTKIVTVQ